MDGLENQLGSRMLAAGLISNDQFIQAMVARRDKPYFRLGEVMLSLGFLTIHQLEEYLAEQYREFRLGDIMVRRGQVTQKQLDHALGLQRERWRLLGTILVELGYCAPEHIKDALQDQQRLAPLDAEAEDFDIG